ncbi:MAG: hypothetical protein WDN26_20875 [Chitinophagaceae bacterium]
MVRRETLNLPYQLQIMTAFSKFCLFIFLTTLLIGCKSKKKASLAGEDPVEVTDFIDFFPAVKLPYAITDTSLLKKDKDSLLISYKVFTQFVPDSVISKVFGKGIKPKIYPMGKVEGEETYLFAKAVAGAKRTAFVITFDGKDNLITAMPFLTPDQNSATQQTASLDSRYTLYKNMSRKNSDGTTSEGKDVYVLNSDAKNFTLIMTDALDDKITELINPIDTFSRKQKNAADYGSGKMNIVSIRDGRKKGLLTFFIHFEKSNGACTGELKGDAIIKSATQAEYREAGDPCSLQFTFTSSGVTLKEIEGCGSRRGLRCSFDGFYPRKKEAKSKPVAKKS